jgi:type I restriction enzyme S subunit
MLNGLLPYSDMKAAEVPWLGYVPSHWSVLRSKYVLREVDNRSESGEETHLSMSQKLGLVPAQEVEQRTLVSESYIGGKLVEVNDLILNRLKAHLGVFAHARQAGLVSPDYTVLRPNENADVRYFEFVLRSPSCRAELRTRAKGIVEGFWRLYTNDFYDIRLPVPPLDEQRLIVRFLDWHGSQTARLVREKRKLITLLNEQLEVMVHRMVTRGLDRTAKLRSTRIPWLGDVPESWDVTSLSSVSDLIQTGPFGSQLPASAYVVGGVPVINPSHIGNGQITPEETITVSEETASRLSRHRFQVGDIVLARRGELGRCAVVGEREAGWVCGTGSIRLRVRSDALSPNYCARLLGDTQIRSALKLASIGATMDNLNEGMIGDLKLAVPPLPEQERIEQSISLLKVDVASLVATAERELSLIQEFRARLISDVITGKLDIRAVATTLPVTLLDEPVEDLIEDAIDQTEPAEVAA